MPYLSGKEEADSIIVKKVWTFPSSYRTSSFASVMSRIIDYKCFILVAFKEIINYGKIQRSQSKSQVAIYC
jgi:hypothetical protein